MKTLILRTDRIAPRAFLIMLILPLTSCFGACDRTVVPPLATVEQIGPGVIEPGDVIRIKGNGFVEGPTRIVFKGAFEPVGLAAPEVRTVDVDGNAVSETLIEAPVTAEVMKRLANEPSRFVGNARITFPTASSLNTVHIVATAEGVAFDLRPAGGGVPLAAQRSREGIRLLNSFGMVVSDPVSGDGLEVKEVIPKSSAAQAGVEFGDRLLAVDGRALASPADLAGLSPSESHQFEMISRRGTARRVELSYISPAHLQTDEFASIVLSSIALGLFLAFAAPTRRKLTRPTNGQIDPFARAVGFALVSIVLLLVPACAILSRAGFGASLALLSANVLGLAGLSFFARGTIASRFARFVAHAFPVPAMIAVAGASSSAMGFFDFVASQEASTWKWHAWSSPFALTLVFASLALLWPSLPQSGQNRRLGSVAAWIAATPAAAMLTTCCLGGWLIPGIPLSAMASSSFYLALGCLVFFVKTWLVLLIARSFAAADILERRNTGDKSRIGLRFIALGAAVALTLGWLWADMPLAMRVAGQILATAASVTVFTALSMLGLKRVRQI